MPQGRSGVPGTSCSGLGTQVTPNASLQQLKKSRNGREQKQTSVEKNKAVFAFAHHHFLPTHVPYFFKCFRFAYCHALCASDVLHSFVPHSLQTHFTTYSRHGFGAHRFFSGGVSGVRASLFFVRALAGRNGPPDPPFKPVRPDAGALHNLRSFLTPVVTRCLISTVIFRKESSCDSLVS